MRFVLRSQSETNSYEDTQSFEKIEYEDKLQTAYPIKFDFFKFFLVIIPLVVSIVGLLMVKYYIWFRVAMFWKNCQVSQATHLYMKGYNKAECIGSIVVNQSSRRQIQFFFQRIRYKIVQGHNKIFVPVLYPYWTNFKQYSTAYMQNGLNSIDILNNRNQYGQNSHKVDLPFYFEFIFTILIQPLFLWQYLFLIVFIFQNLLLFAMILLISSFITATFNYILEYRSLKSIKSITERLIKVRVIRNGKQQIIDSILLVPGDIYIPQEEIMADCILLQGYIYLNEANLTGQSVPIGKYAVTSADSIKMANRWLYEGSTLVNKMNPLALVVKTGFLTRKSRIIYQIMHRISSKPRIVTSMMYFMLESVIVAQILYFIALHYLLSFHFEISAIILLFFDFLAYGIPPATIIFINIAYSICLIRLGLKDILCTQSCKTVQCSNLRNICFDKTGTLTQCEVKIQKVMFFCPSKEEQVTVNNQKSILIYKLFSCCHSIQLVDGQIKGDYIDLQMFKFCQFSIKKSDDVSILFEVVNKIGDNLQILKINQYQPQYQSMSVLVYDCIIEKYFVFVKGAHERIQQECVQKMLYEDRLIDEASIDGLRTIFFGYKQVPQDEVKNYLEHSREKFLEGIHTLGMATFENQLREGAKTTIEEIIRSGVEPVIITGDNMFVAISIAVKIGILSKQSTMILLEGSQQNEHIRNKNGELVVTMLTISNDKLTKREQYIKQDNFVNGKYNNPIIINTDFLLLKPQPKLPKGVKIFARASPQCKFKIIKTLKQTILKDHQRKKWHKRYFGPLQQKVAMVGDGINDLIALKQADIGFSISRSGGASYGATFSISKLADICEVMRFSKCTQRNIIQGYRYYSIVIFIRIPIRLMLIEDQAYITINQTVYLTMVVNVVMIAGIFFSCPVQRCSKYSPCSNFMGIQNQLVFWGTNIIYTIGLISANFYFKSTDEFIPNDHDHDELLPLWDGHNKITTVHWLLLLVPSIMVAIHSYRSIPWKQPVWKNLWLGGGFFINFALMCTFYFITQHGQFIDLLFISHRTAGILLVIMLSTALLATIYNFILEKMEFHQIHPSQSPLKTLSSQGQKDQQQQQQAPESKDRLQNLQ